MNNFKETLKKELNRDAPYTSILEQRLIQNAQKSKQKKWMAPAAVSVGFLVVLLFLIFLQESPKPLKSTAEAPFEKILEEIQKNEIEIPIVNTLADDEWLLEDADTVMNGRFSLFNDYPLIIEQATSLKVGDYVVLELEDGKKAVRQLIAFEGQTFTVQEGFVYIDNEPLLMPGIVFGYQYKDLQDFREASVYFDNLSHEPWKIEETEVRKGFVLIHENDSSDIFPMKMVATTEIVGKVRGIQQLQPTFVLEGEQLAQYEAFKKTKDLELLKGNDPITMMRIYLMAMMEHDVETVYALFPSSVKVHDISIERFEYVWFAPYRNMSIEAIQTQLTLPYSGIENGEINYDSTNKIAKIEYNAHLNHNESRIVEMTQTIDGIWELLSGSYISIYRTKY